MLPCSDWLLCPPQDMNMDELLGMDDLHLDLSDHADSNDEAFCDEWCHDRLLGHGILNVLFLVTCLGSRIEHKGKIKLRFQKHDQKLYNRLQCSFLTRNKATYFSWPSMDLKNMTGGCCCMYSLPYSIIYCWSYMCFNMHGLWF